MSKKLLLTVAGALVVAGTIAAISQPGPRRHHGGEMMFGDRGGPMGPGMRLKALDADKDGEITLAEFIAPREKRFAAIDKNSDGAIDAEEAAASMRERADASVKRLMRRLDRDGDLKISAREFRRAARRHGRTMGWEGRGRMMSEEMRERMAERMAEHKARREAAAEAGKTAEDKGKAAEDKAAEDKAPDARDAHRAEHPGKGWREARRERMREGREERRARLDAAFKHYDRNGDGFIDAAEIDAAAAERVEFWTRRFMHRFDQDKDGKVARDEFLRFARERFAALDLNGDGKITEDDLAPWMRGQGILK